MTWYLIFAIYLTADKGGISITSIEFPTKQGCVAAGTAMALEWKRGSMGFIDQSRFVCVEKK